MTLKWFVVRKARYAPGYKDKILVYAGLKLLKLCKMD